MAARSPTYQRSIYTNLVRLKAAQMLREQVFTLQDLQVDNKTSAEIDEASDGPKEHIAGPNCKCTQGYSGWHITAAEMRVSKPFPSCILSPTKDRLGLYSSAVLEY